MTNLQSLTVAQLRKVVAIKEQIETLTAELASMTEGDAPAAGASPQRRRRKMSAATRARMAAAQQKRWAKVKGPRGKAAETNGVVKKKRKVSAATRARLAASAKIRWAKARAAGESAL
jgi:hypothetical protein